MNKLSVYLLSLFCLLLFANCNTSVKVTNKGLESDVVQINSKRLTIVYENTDLTKDFMISLKNHLVNELKNRGISSQITNSEKAIRDGILIKLVVISERGRNLYHATGVVKSFREAVIDVELKNTEGRVFREKQIHVNHVYNSEITAAAREAAQKLVKQLNITN